MIRDFYYYNIRIIKCIYLSGVEKKISFEINKQRHLHNHWREKFKEMHLTDNKKKKCGYYFLCRLCCLSDISICTFFSTLLIKRNMPVRTIAILCYFILFLLLRSVQFEQPFSHIFTHQFLHKKKIHSC